MSKTHRLLAKSYKSDAQQTLSLPLFNKAR